MDGTKKDKARIDWERKYRKQERYYSSFIRKYDKVMEERWLFRKQAYDLTAELSPLRRENYEAYRKIDRLEQRVERLEAENAGLRKQLEGVKSTLDSSARTPPPFVKPNVPGKRKKRPGRKAGHEAALRPMPERIDRTAEVPPPVDALGVPCCPDCNAQLQKLKWHKRIVEDIDLPKPIVTCYHTASGYCPGCRKRIETRAPEQPPAADLPHGQVGINALAMAGLMRVVYRMPYELISQLMADLPGIRISKGALAKQITRMGKWLEKEYAKLMVFLRMSPAVHMDETGWRVDGKNRWLWALLDDRHTLFHVDKSRGSKVVVKLLGAVYGGTLVTDFYAAYNQISCRKQKCLVHLLRELRDTSAKNPVFAAGPFAGRLKRLIKEMLMLKKQKAELPSAEYQRKGKRLGERLKELAEVKWNQADANRIAKRARKHIDELTLFLWEEVDATNNAAERALRPAVVMRKITGGSRSERGARATAVLMSVMRTARQQDLPMFQTIKRLMMNAWANEDAGLLTNAPADSS